MKKVLVVVVVLAVAIMVASSAFAGVLTSRHDLSWTSATHVGAVGATISACQFCHTPHLRVASTSMAPLWNKSMSSAAYNMYTAVSGTVSAGPGEASKTCLSCHDGTMSTGNVIVGGNQTTFTAIANRVNAAGVLLDGGSAAAPNYMVGTDLRNDHPIGVSYPTAGGGAAGLQPFAGGTDPTIYVGNATKRWKVYTTGAEYKVECGSCHDPHNTNAGETPFLKGTKNTICEDCHSTK